MSYWVNLEDRNAPALCDFPISCSEPCYPVVTVEHFEDGGTMVLGGTTEASLNITWNYSSFYYEHLNADEGLRYLNNKRAGDVLQDIERVVGILGTYRDKDYWAATPGNAGSALARLAAWARQYPDAVFSVH